MADQDDVKKDLLEQLGQTLDRVESSDSLRSFLDQGTRFWRYSASNIAMLVAQAEQRGMRPTLVAGFNEWKREGRAPRKGEHGLRILAPIASRSYKAVLADGSTTRFSQKQDVPTDATVTGVLSGLATRFRLATVFDVTQTSGEPIVLPSRKLPPSDRAAELYSRLGELCEDIGFTVRESAEQHSLSSGFTNHNDHEIVLGNWLPLEDRVAILAHEYGHAVLHGPTDPLGASYAHGTEHRGLAEVEAESVAYVILRAHDIDSTMRSAEYLAGWSDAVREATPLLRKTDAPPKRSDVVRSVLGRVMGASKTALMATEPPGNGGKPAHRHLDLDAGAAVTVDRERQTGPTVQPAPAREVDGPGT